jgi:peptidylprolyl isomerase
MLRSRHRLLKAVIGLGSIVIAATASTQSLNAQTSGYRYPDAENTLVIDTSKGRVVVEMYPQLAPNHVERMKTLVRQNFYDGQKFHRVIEGFMAQTGDPKGTGEGGSDLPDIEAEFTVKHGTDFPMYVVAKPKGSVLGFVGALPVQSQAQELMELTRDNKVQAWGLFCQGVLGMARSGDPNSANSQFFLMRGANAVLEKRYTAFGAILSGLDVVRKLKIGEPPKDPDTMLKVQLLADMPQAERPKLEVMDTNSNAFKAEIDKVRKRQGADFSACDVTVPVNVPIMGPVVGTVGGL